MKKFPDSPCYVCNSPIENLEGAFIAAHDYPGYLDYLKNTDKTSENELFVNSVTSQYFSQFPNFFREKNPSNLINLGDFVTDRLIDENAPNYRLDKILKNPPNKFLFLLTHDQCHPSESEITPYYIDLPRIDTPRKALEWTFHLNEKNWFNPKGWIKTLENLYGRFGV
jgi:hypothetical protein